MQRNPATRKNKGEKTMFDVYLGGVAAKKWREKFKSEISDDISIFDPLVENYEQYDKKEIANQAARELIYIYDKCKIIVFYLDPMWQGTTTLLEIGNAIGRGKQVVVCLDGNVNGKEKIYCHCDYHGVLVVDTIEELISAVEECAAQVELCKT